MYLRVIVAACIVLGTVWVFYVNYRAKRSDVGGRKRVMSLPVYSVANLYLMISTPAVSVAAILYDHGALLEVHDQWWLLALGSLVAGAGMALFVVARRYLGRQFTPCYAAHLPSELVASGPYRFVRHPVYTASIMLPVGLFIAAGSLWIVFNLVLLLAFLIPIIAREERSILAEFPEYAQYAAQTGRLIPRLF